MLLKDKVVVVSGVGPGMGGKLASIAATEGAQVAAGARSRAFLDELRGEIEGAGGRCLVRPTDIGDMAQCQALVDDALHAYGRVDGLINCAYKVATFRSFEADTIEEWSANIDITCIGALRMAKAVLPAMKAQGGGAIVNIGALAAAQPAQGQADYAVAKAALEGATRQLAKEFGPYNIRVNCARMGWLWGAPVKGFIAHQAQAAGRPESEFIEPIRAKIPLGVIPPEEECARTALLFLSDYTKMVTGAVLDVNGGEYFAG